MRFVTLFIALVFLSLSTFGAKSPVYKAKATFYGKKFTKSKTYSGERYNANKYTAAHRSFPMQSLVKVTNTKNDKYVIVRINDRFSKEKCYRSFISCSQTIGHYKIGNCKKLQSNY